MPAISLTLLTLGCAVQAPQPSSPSASRTATTCEPTIARMVPPDFVVEHVLGGVRPADNAAASPVSLSPRAFASDKNYLGNDLMWLALPPDGRARGGSVSITAYQTVAGRITVVGRRIDQTGTDTITTERDENPGGGPRDRAITIYFPTQGCWEVIYGLAGTELRFVIEVRG